MAMNETHLGPERTYMYRDEKFQTTALDCGFVEENLHRRGRDSVVWLTKEESGDGRNTHQRMCVDDMTNSATVYWMAVTGRVDSKTFREVPALRKWLEAPQEIFANR
jgi:hypothetical protein